MKYLTLIRTIALLHQYQRPVKTVAHRGQTLRYIEVTTEDIALANRLCHEVLGRSLDELPPQTRRLLGLLEEMVQRGVPQGRDRPGGFPLHAPRRARAHAAGATRRSRCTSGACSRWSTWSCTAGARGRATSTSSRTRARARTARRFCPACSTSRASTAQAGTTADFAGGGGRLRGGGRPPVGAESGTGSERCECAERPRKRLVARSHVADDDEPLHRGRRTSCERRRTRRPAARSRRAGR